MKFFLDENIPTAVGTYLEALQNTVFDIRGTSDEGLSDEKIFELSQKHKAIFITTDKDFFHTVPFLYPKHEGIIVVALSQPNTKNILEKVKYAVQFLRKNKILSRCLLMTDSKMHITINKPGKKA